MMSSDQWGGVWTEAKVKALKDYLHSYQRALKNTRFHRSYIDALSGDGTWRSANALDGLFLGLDESERAAGGSGREGCALAALDVEPPFDQYVFNDLDGDKVEKLRQRAVEQGRNLHTVESKALEANEFIREICGRLNPRRQRGVILLDPWGMQVDWSSTATIAHTGCLDMWYLFPTQAVVRMLPRAGIPNDTWCKKLDLTLGNTDWREQFYRVDTVDGDLFGHAEHKIERNASFAAVEQYVVRRLKTTFAGTVLDEPLRLGRRRNPIFSFCFASANPSVKARGLTSRLANGVVRANRAS